MDVTNTNNNNLQIFRERLKMLRGNKRLQDVAQDLGISRVTLGYYESGERKPDIEILLRIANYYNVSCDYLLGLTETQSLDMNVREISHKIGLNEKSVEILCSYKSYNDNHPENNISEIYLTTVDDILLYNNLIEDIAHYLYFQFDCAYDSKNHENIIDSSEIEFLDRKIGKPFQINSDYISDFLLSRVKNSLIRLRERYCGKKETPIINDIPFVSEARWSRKK